MDKLKESATDAVKHDCYSFVFDNIADPTFELATFLDAALNIENDQDLANNIRLLVDNMIAKAIGE